mgnify:CR=1 FL=1
MNKIIPYSFLLVLTFFMVGCSSNTNLSETASYYTLESQCINSNDDGTLLLRVFGKGMNKASAREDAKKKAVKDVLFNGIKNGSINTNSYLRKALVLDVNGQEKYKYFFEPFFKSNGEYSQYVEVVEDNTTSRLYSDGKTMKSIGIIVRVDVSGLRKRLIEAGIIKLI